jgi:hypothetical protein
VEIPAHAGRLRAQLYASGAVLAEEVLEEGGWALDVTVSDARWSRMLAAEPAAR